MTTKLEAMIGYLAGRQGNAAESIRRELEDPGSEASRWLEAVQSRSHELLRPAPSVALDLTEAAGAPDERAARRSVGRRLLPFLYGLCAASLAFTALGIAWRVQEERLLRLESLNRERESRWGTRLDEVATALAARPKRAGAQEGVSASPEPAAPQAKPAATAAGVADTALARIEARIGRVEDRLKESLSGQNQADPTIDELRREVEQLRKDTEARALASRQESQEISQIVQEALQLLRRLETRPWGPDPMQPPVTGPLPENQRRAGQGPGFFPGADQVPGQAQMPDNFGPGLGQGLREGRLQGHSGGHSGPRMQRPGGPG